VASSGHPPSRSGGRRRWGNGRGRSTPEERAAEQAYSEDLDRRMLEMIERYRKLIAEKRASGGQA
jgi:hypothetical protein